MGYQSLPGVQLGWGGQRSQGLQSPGLTEQWGWVVQQQGVHHPSLRRNHLGVGQPSEVWLPAWTTRPRGLLWAQQLQQQALTAALQAHWMMMQGLQPCLKTYLAEEMLPEGLLLCLRTPPVDQLRVGWQDLALLVQGHWPLGLLRWTADLQWGQGWGWGSDWGPLQVRLLGLKQEQVGPWVIALAVAGGLSWERQWPGWMQRERKQRGHNPDRAAAAATAVRVAVRAVGEVPRQGFAGRPHVRSGLQLPLPAVECR